MSTSNIQRPSRIHPEELVIYGLALFIGLVPVISAIATHSRWGFEAVVGLGMMILGAIGLVSFALRTRSR